MKFTSTIIAALVAAALTGQATGIKLKAEHTINKITSIRSGTGSILISQSLRILKLVLREHFSGRRGRYTLMTGVFGLWVIVGVSDG